MLEDTSRPPTIRYAIALAILLAGFSSGASVAQWTADNYLVAPGDFNGDGKDDLLVIARDPALPSGIALNDGSGQPSVLHQSWGSNYLGITWSGETYVPHVGDFDGDNRDDVFLQRVSGGNHYVLKVGVDGKFTSIHQTIANSYLAINWSLAERRIVVGDFNNNGQDDLFLQSNLSPVDNVVALAGSGGSFLTKSHDWPDSYLSLLWSLPKEIAHAGDFDADGYADLLVQAKPNWLMIPYDDLLIPVPQYRPESYGIVLSDATGKATTVSDTWNHDHLGLEWSTLHYDIVVGYFDANNCADILLQAKDSSRSSYIVLTNCSGQVPTGATVHTLSAGVNWDQASYQLHIADFDGNGRSEIYMQATAFGGTNRIAYTTTSGNVTSTPATHTPSSNFKKPVPGAIAASFRVGDQGEALYSMPIVTPEGTGGLKPSLALTYNHLAGNGLAGMHWTLSGFSAITRCSATFAQDGAVGPITYTNTDRFCLDGQRLVEISGTYGASGTQYRTEIETFQRIEQIGIQGGGPEKFRVDHGNGLSSFFGDTLNSRIEAPGGSAVRAWLISYSEDRFGNQVNYAYDESSSTGEAMPTEITWTQNPAQGLSAKYKVAITPEDRPPGDMRSGYDAGGKVWATTRRIDKIEVSYNAQLIHSYDLTYATQPGTGTGRSQLKQVEQCGPTECFLATAFTVQNGTRGWGGATDTTQPALANRRVGDLNGDGKKDVIGGSAPGNWKVYFGKADGTFAAAADTGVAVGPMPSSSVVTDYGAIGRSALLYKGSGNVWRLLSYSGTSFFDAAPTLSVNPSAFYAADLDGDGRQDLVYHDGSAIRWMQNLGLGIFGSSQLIAVMPGHALIVNSNANALNEVLDFNADGRGDLINLEEYCDTYPPYGELCTPRWTLLVSAGASYEVGAQLQGDIIFTGDIAQVVPVDANGDGADDVLYFTGAGGSGYWSLILSTGVGFGSPTGVGIPYGVMTMAGADYDNDGRDDVIIADGNYLRVFRSNGATYPSLTESIYSPVAGAPYVADFTGDGFADILRAGTNWHLHKHQSALPDVVTAFSDGLGYNVGVQYESLSNSASYSFDPLYGAWPYIGYLVRTRYVVTAENHDDGIGGVRSYTHQYDTASMDVSGRGWQSFHGHRVNDLDQGIYTAKYFEQAFPFAGIVTSEELRRSSDNALIRKVENTPAETVLSATTTPNRRFVRIEDTTVREYEFLGPVPAAGTELRKIEEDPTYNTDFGYVTALLRKVTEPDTGAVWQSSVNFDATRYETPWCLGLPGLVTTENTLPAPNNTPVQRKVRHTFNSTTCKPTDVQDESESDPTKQLKTHFDYNSYGNVTAVNQDSVTTTQPRSTSFLYTDGHQQFPTSMTVAGLNLETTLSWDYRTGQRATVTSPDGLSTSWGYDNFGRVVQETSPVGTTTVRFEDCYYCWPAHARFSVRSQGSDGSDAYDFFDELGRPVGSAATLPLGNPARREIRYNDKGQVAQASQPYVYYDPVYWTTYEFDVLGRIKKENAPISEASPSGAETIYQYLGRDVWVTDAENHTAKYLNNAAGQIRQVIDALGGTTAYTYRPFGELATVTDAGSNVTTIGYDARGNKTSLADPNMGTWAYEHNAHGELWRQRSPMTSAPSWTVTLTYDVGGRLDTREELEGITDFSYYTSGIGAGKVDTITGPDGDGAGGADHALKYSYHPDHGQPTQIRHTFNGTAYNFDLSYDGHARLDLLTYPTSTSGYQFKVDYDHDPFGHLTVAKDGNAPSTVFYRLDEVDALGRQVLAHLGNGLDEQHDYDRASLLLKTIQTGPSFGTSIQNLSITHDEVGNVLSRTNATIGKTETFTYDALNRLKTTQVSGLAQNVIEYDGNGVGVGRITSRTDVGAYVYTGGSCGGGPSAVKSAAGLSYCYDAAGRMTSRGGSSNTISWTSYDLPSSIKYATQTDEFSYGVDRARYKQVRKTGTTTDATILYVGSLLERETVGGTDTWRHFVNVGGRTVAKVERVGTTNTTQYLHRDHQSSVVEITSSTGTLAQSLAYDPWGLRRNASTWAPLGNPFSGAPAFKRGYTGHEHLDNVELIHMNGRVQDPRLGTFISADPFVQAPYHSQSLNRYSYVWNNPLTFVDPSGFQPDVDGAAAEENLWQCKMVFICDPRTPIADSEPFVFVGRDDGGAGSDRAIQGGRSSRSAVNTPPLETLFKAEAWELRKRELLADPRVRCFGDSCQYTDDFFVYYFESPDGRMGFGPPGGGISGSGRGLVGRWLAARAARSAGAAVNRTIDFSRLSSLSKAFALHGRDFGVVGTGTQQELRAFTDALQAHAVDDATQVIIGTYRRAGATHFVNPQTGLNVIRDSAGTFWTGWRLNAAQLKNVLERGSL